MKYFYLPILLGILMSCQAKRKSGSSLTDAAAGATGACEETRKRFEEKLKEYLKIMGIEKLSDLKDPKAIAEKMSALTAEEKAAAGKALPGMINDINAIEKIASSPSENGLRVAAAATANAIQQTALEGTQKGSNVTFDSANGNYLNSGTADAKGGDSEKALTDMKEASRTRAESLGAFFTQAFVAIETGVIEPSEISAQGGDSLRIAMTTAENGITKLLELHEVGFNKGFGVAVSKVVQSLQDINGPVDSRTLSNILAQADPFVRATFAAATVEAWNGEGPIDFQRVGLSNVSDIEVAEAKLSILSNIEQPTAQQTAEITKARGILSEIKGANAKEAASAKRLIESTQNIENILKDATNREANLAKIDAERVKLSSEIKTRRALTERELAAERARERIKK